MFHFCMFGGHEGELSGDQEVFVTMFGACELRKPTIAKQLMEHRTRTNAGLPRRKHFFVTLFGATELKSPTLAEEFLSMQEAIRSGALSVGDWDSALAHLSSGDGYQYGSFTFMAGMSSSELPDENEEIEGLAINRHLGHIDNEAGQTLEMGVGRGGAQRASVVRQALASASRAMV